LMIERRGFHESANEALRRFLGCGARIPAGAAPVSKIDTPIGGISWQGKGVVLPAGTKFQMKYNDLKHSGEIIGGKWKVKGESYNSPSQAASSVARTGNGEKTQLNGWIYWRVKRPGDTRWISLDNLRSD